MGIFGQFFERMMDSIDEVEDVKVDPPDTQDDSTSERLEDMNAEVRAEALRDMENQYDEPMDIFDRIIAANHERWIRNTEREALQEHERRLDLIRQSRIREEQREEERRTALTQAISEDVERTVRETFASEYMGRSTDPFQARLSNISEATRHARIDHRHLERLRPAELFGHSATSMWMDEPDPTSARGEPTILGGIPGRPSPFLNEYGIARATTPNEVMQGISDGFDNLRNSLNTGLLPTQLNNTQSIRIPSVITSGNQDYFQIEAQLIEFAELVRSMMQAETPADLKMQQDIVSKQIDNILLKKKDDKKLTPSNEAPASVSLELELD